MFSMVLQRRKLAWQQTRVRRLAQTQRSVYKMIVRYNCFIIILIVDGIYFNYYLNILTVVRKYIVHYLRSTCSVLWNTQLKMNSLSLMKKPVDVTQWLSPLKLSYTDVCSKFGIDVINDHRNAFFWNMMLDKKLVVNNDLLDWCGYSGEYKTKKLAFISLLKKNPHILYQEIQDQIVTKKRYVVMEPLDFESILMQMRSRKAQEIRELYSFLKHISIQYMKYEKYYEEHRNEVMSHQNNQLTQSVHELKDLVLQVKHNADEEIERAEKRHLEVTDKLTTIKKRIRTEVVDRLRTDIAPLVSPTPINLNKERCLGLICVKPRREWYIIRRQRETFKKAVETVIRKNGGFLAREWHAVPHAVDIGNALKQRLRNLKWMARGNILRVDNGEANYSNDQLIYNIEAIIRDNAAIELSKDAEKIIE